MSSSSGQTQDGQTEKDRVDRVSKGRGTVQDGLEDMMLSSSSYISIRCRSR